MNSNFIYSRMFSALCAPLSVIAFDLNAPMVTPRISIATGYSFAIGHLQYHKGSTPIPLDSLTHQPIEHRLPIELKLGAFQFSEFFLGIEGLAIRNNGNDAVGLSTLEFGIKTSFKEYYGLGFLLSSQFAMNSGSLDNAHIQNEFAFNYGGYLFKRWKHIQLAAAFTQSLHPSSNVHPDLATQEKMEIKPEVIWREKYFGFWVLTYHHWQSIEGLNQENSIPEKFKLSMSPGFAFQFRKDSRLELNYFYDASGKNLIVNQGLEFRILLALTE